MDWAGRAVLRDSDPVYMHGDEIVGPIRITGWIGGLRRRVSPASTNLADDLLNFWIGV